jgi:hypothetical protein
MVIGDGCRLMEMKQLVSLNMLRNAPESTTHVGDAAVDDDNWRVA